MNSKREDLVEAAAFNNAAWCDLFARLHEVDGVFEADAWTSRRRTPELYPDAVTLLPSVDPASLVSRIDRSPGSSVKDSFADLDLTPWGFEPLFEASWIHFSAPIRGTAEATPLLPVRSEALLAAWEAAWGESPIPGRFFPTALLARPDVVVLAAVRDDFVEAGTILSIGGGAAGVSNLFVTQDALASGSSVSGAFATAGAIGRAMFPGLPIVGYERGDGLAAAIDAGFEPLGPLAVWLRPTDQR
ncbi:MAG: hypothetical protein ACJ77B_02700 [Chloroflexota bacterium]